MKKLEKFFKEYGLKVCYNSYGMSVLKTISGKEVSPRFAGEAGLKLWSMKNQERILQTR